MSAIKRIRKCGLTGELDSAEFTDHHDSDLTGVFQLILYSFRDVAGKLTGFDIADFILFDHDTDFATGLKRERLRDSGE
jgi:hypothetical protein